MHYLGNDVVDLECADNLASAANPRFAARVLTSDEQHRLARHPSPDGLLWAYWSAKEAAYKALKKADPELAFIHRNFHVSFNTNSRGTVVVGDTRIAVSWQWTAEWVHCVTETANTVHRVSHFSRGTDSTSGQSVAARMLATELLHENGVDDARIVRPEKLGRRGPPVVNQHGQTLRECEVSLSHDGRFVAAAIDVSPLFMKPAGAVSR